MGYTHYFSQHRDLSTEEWQWIQADFRRLLDVLPAHGLCGGAAYPDAPLRLSGLEISEDLIAFNGAGRFDGMDLDHETMVLFRRLKDAEQEDPWRACQRPLFQFCKTERKPYDLAVCALLTLVGDLAPDAFAIGSDGNPAEWKPAIDWVRATVRPNCWLPFPEDMPRVGHRPRQFLPGG